MEYDYKKDLMNMFDQKLRELKRGVNRTVLKVPEIEQKVLDATCNEPWGPHGSTMAEIANASRNYTDYVIIMACLWKRLQSKGKNWRHVYKGLTLLEYLIANGSERILIDVREHLDELQTLSIEFYYIQPAPPHERDQGVNVRKKAEALLALINDKDKIEELRVKAAANKHKYYGIASTNFLSRNNEGDRLEDDQSLSTLNNSQNIAMARMQYRSKSFVQPNMNTHVTRGNGPPSYEESIDITKRRRQSAPAAYQKTFKSPQTKVVQLQTQPHMIVPQRDDYGLSISLPSSTININASQFEPHYQMQLNRELQKMSCRRDQYGRSKSLPSSTLNMNLPHPQPQRDQYGRSTSLQPYSNKNKPSLEPHTIQSDIDFDDDFNPRK